MTEKYVVKVKVLDPEVEGLTPIHYGRPGDAGIDLRSSGHWKVDLDGEKKDLIADSYSISPMERILIRTNIAVQIPEGFWFNVRDRSGLAMKHGIHILAGVIDETYRGEIGVVVANLSKNEYTFKKNEKVAQFILQRYATAEIQYVPELDDSNRGDGGFGSSGTH